MLTISIVVVSRGERSLGAVLDSIRAQNATNVEVVTVNATTLEGKPDDSLGPNFKFINVRTGTGLLEARCIGVSRTRGDLLLLLDSTRLLRPYALSRCIELGSSSDMVIFGEGAVGSGFWASLTKLDKRLSLNPSSGSRLSTGNRLYALPRLYSGGLLRQAVDELRREIPADQFSRIRHGDHQLLFVQCLKHSKSVRITKEELIDHIEDETLVRIVDKYFGYGRSHRVISKLPVYRSTADVTRFVRDHEGVSLKSRLILTVLYVARGVPFILGYIVGPEPRKTVSQSFHD